MGLASGAAVVTRSTNPDGTNHRYEMDGRTFLKASRRLYTHASVYVLVNPSDRMVKEGRTVGHVDVCLHSREDLAVKGNPDVSPNHYRRAGHVAIVEVLA